MFMFQTLKFVPGGEIFHIEYEAFPILLFGLGGALLVLVPFLDRSVTSGDRSPGFTVAGFLVICYIVIMTSWGYASLVPLWIVLGMAGMIFVLRKMMHGGGGRPGHE
jgi:quinol-cytochrome oxidoreductase complex cytochrome b subunit